MAAPYLHIVRMQVRFGEADSWVHQGFSIALDSVAETLFVRCFTQPVLYMSLPCELGCRLRGLLQRLPGRTEVCICGHSLGGVLNASLPRALAWGRRGSGRPIRLQISA